MTASVFGLILLLFVYVVQTVAWTLFGHHTADLSRDSKVATFLNHEYVSLKMDEPEVTEKLNYVLNKYEEVEMKLIGTPIGLRGNRVTYGDTEELDINFQYLDNTLHDVIQNCVFVLLKKPGECETISTVCNTFLPITPRPLLSRETLTVCDDDDEVAEAEQVKPTENDAMV